MMRRILSLALPLITVAAAAGEPSRHFDGVSWWRTVSVLADDRYEGRETGSRGEAAARAWLVRELKAAHVGPVPGHGYAQPVELVARDLDEAASRLTLVQDGREEPLVLGDDAILSTRVALAPELEAPLAFVGYGLSAPEAGYDDLAGRDLHGKVAVYLTGSPASMSAELAAHYASSAERWKALRAAGAVGVLVLPNPASMDVPWSRIVVNRLLPSMVLADAAFDDLRGEAFAATLNPARAERLFTGTGHTFAELAELARTRAALPPVALQATLRARTRLSTRAVHAANTVALVPGSDPVLRREVVVLSAHLDHLGIGQPINGDAINNGAMDNASGSALLLDLARALAHSAHRPKRSVLFVWLTAEEKGLLGSRYYAERPTVPGPRIVANVNIDMFLPIVPLRYVTVYGLAESDLGDVANSVIGGLGLEVQADPEPLRNLFVRSDQYNFVKQGVPALALKVGAAPGSVEATVLHDWLTRRYHAPSDDTRQPVNLATAGGFEDAVYALAVEIANRPERPAWKAGSFFRRYAH